MRYTKIVTAFILLTLNLFNCKALIGEQGNNGSLSLKIDSINYYTFIPTSANPLVGRTIQLTGGYSLKVSQDSIISYLPYFGQAYAAPISFDEGGIKFISTKFDYKTNKKKDGWKIDIETQETKQKYQLHSSIGTTGYATLVVNENNRQSISFYGTIE